MDRQLSILIPYRKRPQHLAGFLQWFQELATDAVEAIFVEQDSEPTIDQEIEKTSNCRYHFVQDNGPFKMSQNLNTALELSQATLVAPYDIDLVPWENTLLRQMKFALKCQQLLISGYRLMTRIPQISRKNIKQAFAESEVSTSEHPHFLLQRMVQNEKYGVVPMYRAGRLKGLGGWDERYIGWGAEDQDMLERYLSNDILLLRSEQLIYLHQHHGFEANWRENEFIVRNRERFFAERKGLS